MAEQKRLSININDQTADALREISHTKGLTITETVRRAVSVYKFFEDELAAGRKIQTMRTGGGDKRDVELI
ncbi:MAG: CopG family transcriptional regulator [Micrococcus sp.]|nr:CopG family transcriptional regulator [Micrococcus sp.]